MLFGNTLFNVSENEESRITTLSGNESPAAEFTHQGLDCFHISFALLDTTRNALAMAKKKKGATITGNNYVSGIMLLFVFQVLAVALKRSEIGL